MKQFFILYAFIGVIWNSARTQELTSFEDRQFNHDPSADLPHSEHSDAGPAKTRQKKTSPAPIISKPEGSKASDSLEENHQSYNSGVQFRAYGGDQGTGRSSDGSNGKWPIGKKKQAPPLPPIASKQPTKGPPPIDESFVSALFKHPEAIKIVYDYLEEQKAFSTTNPPTTTSTTRKPTTTKTTTTKTTTASTKRSTTASQTPSLKSTFPLQPPPKPLSANQAKINRLNSLFGLGLLGENNPSSNPNAPSTKAPETKRDKFPSLASIFGSLEKLDSQPPRKSIFSFQRPAEPPIKPDKVENPLLNGQKKPDFQFFGPSDFVPKSKFSLPVHTNGPMQLKYVSAKDFPFNTPFGIVPIPR